MQLDELYRQVIMDHYQNPRNQGQLEDALSVDLRNPSCGDEITLQLSIKDGIVDDVRFKGSGCSISMSSASMMTEAIKGKPVQEALKIADVYRAMVKGEDVDTEALGDLEALAGVAKFPARFKCATLAFNALERAVKSGDSSEA